MALVKRPDPRRKLMLAVALDLLLVAFGVALFVASGSVLWLMLSVFIGAGVSAPLVIGAIREIKEQSNASG